MQIETIVKAAYLIQAGCAIGVLGVSISSVKAQRELNRTIAEGTKQIAEGNAIASNLIASIR